jgi:hypothetical protein
MALGYLNAHTRSRVREMMPFPALQLWIVLEQECFNFIAIGNQVQWALVLPASTSVPH